MKTGDYPCEVESQESGEADQGEQKPYNYRQHKPGSLGDAAVHLSRHKVGPSNAESLEDQGRSQQQQKKTNKELISNNIF